SSQEGATASAPDAREGGASRATTASDFVNAGDVANSVNYANAGDYASAGDVARADDFAGAGGVESVGDDARVAADARRGRVTLGLSLRDCVRASMRETADAVREKIERTAARLVPTVNEIGDEFGLRIANKRISITPASLVADQARSAEELMPLARAIDEAAGTVGVDFIGGYSALVHKGLTRGESVFVDSIPEALASTERMCSSLNVATTRAGINMDAVRRTGELIKE